MTKRITAEICREEAKAVAIDIQGTHDAAYRAALASVGSFWIDLGRLSLALGDPDELVEVLQRRRDSGLGRLEVAVNHDHPPEVFTPPKYVIHLDELERAERGTGMIDVNLLGQALGQVHGRWPNAVIVVNQVQNLSVLVDDEYVAWIDIGLTRPGTGELHVLGEHDETPQ